MTKTDIKHRRCIALMVVLLIFGVLISFRIGRYPVPLQELLGILGGKLGLVREVFWTKQMESAVWNVRLPRILLSVLVGACLSAAGAASSANRAFPARQRVVFPCLPHTYRVMAALII